MPSVSSTLTLANSRGPLSGLQHRPPFMPDKCAVRSLPMIEGHYFAVLTMSPNPEAGLIYPESYAVLGLFACDHVPTMGDVQALANEHPERFGFLNSF
ncbi:MAG: hypothetical protein WC205_16800 [Opitutaceae bacterium]|jgi:hypothetical protein